MKRKLEWGAWGVVMAWAIAALWPASFWHDAGQVRVYDYTSGAASVEMAFTGGPLRDFSGSYSVVVRDARTGAVVAEDASGVFRYQAGSQRPYPLTVEWWAPRAAATIRALPPGDYSLQTCWTVYALPLVWPKVTCHDPALFHVA